MSFQSLVDKFFGLLSGELLILFILFFVKLDFDSGAKGSFGLFSFLVHYFLEKVLNRFCCACLLLHMINNKVSILELDHKKKKKSRSWGDEISCIF